MRGRRRMSGKALSWCQKFSHRHVDMGWGMGLDGHINRYKALGRIGCSCITIGEITDELDNL
jgi:hypothetical protein